MAGRRKRVEVVMSTKAGRPLRVLFFIPNLGGGGAERVLTLLLKNIARQRFEPHLVVIRLEGPHASSLPEDIEITELRCRSLWTATPKLIQVVRSLVPDVIVGTTGGAGVPAVLAHRFAFSNARLIIWERSVLVGSEKTLRRSLLLALKKMLWPRADLVTAVGYAVEEDIRKHIRISPQKTAVLYSPILDENFRLLAQEDVRHPWFSEDVPIILCVARLVPAKDHATLIEGFSLLRAEREARLVLLGDGPLSAELRQHVTCLGLDSSVLFAGFVENPFKYMARSRILALTSLQEGVPGVVVQAMALKLPVVATDSQGGTSELIRNERTGLLIPTGAPLALSRALIRLLDDPALANKLADSASESVKRFEVREAISAYESLLEGEPVSQAD